MPDQMPPVEVHQYVFAAPRKAAYKATADVCYLFANRPAQAGFAQNDAFDYFTADVRFDTAAGGLDFG